MEAVLSVQLNQDQAVQSEPSLELSVLAGGCFWGVEDLLRDDTRTVCAAAAAPTQRSCLSYQSIVLNQ
jgi:peptide methionine sulfoxide reductase MsrA